MPTGRIAAHRMQLYLVLDRALLARVDAIRDRLNEQATVGTVSRNDVLVAAVREYVEREEATP